MTHDDALDWSIAKAIANAYGGCFWLSWHVKEGNDG